MNKNLSFVVSILVGMILVGMACALIFSASTTLLHNASTDSIIKCHFLGAATIGEISVANGTAITGYNYTDNTISVTYEDESVATLAITDTDNYEYTFTYTSDNMLTGDVVLKLLFDNGVESHLTAQDIETVKQFMGSSDSENLQVNTNDNTVVSFYKTANYLSVKLQEIN